MKKRDPFMRIAAAAPAVALADPGKNAEHICAALEALEAEGVEMAVLPELCLTGYTCGDLFHSRRLLEATLVALDKLLNWSVLHDIVFAVGLPVEHGGALYNCAALVARGKVLGLTAKTHLPNYNEFYERRWFRPAPEQPVEVALGGYVKVTMSAGNIYDVNGVGVGIEICEDLWAPEQPSTRLALGGAEVILNLSASNDLVGKYQWLKGLVKTQSSRLHCAYCYAGAGNGESTTDTVYAGKAMVAENGVMLAEAERWMPGPCRAIADVDLNLLRHDRMHDTTFGSLTRPESRCGEWGVGRGVDSVDIQCSTRSTHNLSPSTLKYRKVDPSPFVPGDDRERDARCQEIVNIQVAGLVRRVMASYAKTLVVGVSGGLDSTLALLVAARAMDCMGRPRKEVIGVTMPGFGTTGRTHNNATALMKELGVTIRDISIAAAVMQHFADIGHDETVHDVTYENSQARERTQILMDLANQTGGIVVGTGDMSELALGWATYNGDHMSMYGVNAGVPKTLVSHLVSWFADTASAGSALQSTLRDVLDTPVSPELTPPKGDGTIAQVTEDIVGPYRLHDFFLYHTLRHGADPLHVKRLALKAFEGEYDEAEIDKWLQVFTRRFFQQQFKRSCLPDGPKVGSVCLSPRGDWRMPSDASYEAFK